LPGDSLLVLALEDLVRGRARLSVAAGEDVEELLRVGIHFDRGVDGLRRAGTYHHLPRGLLTRADLLRRRGDYQRAQEDLEEARSVAERGEMRLHLADYWIGKARLERDLGERVRCEEAISEAVRLIASTGYLRRVADLQELQR